MPSLGIAPRRMTWAAVVLLVFLAAGPFVSAQQSTRRPASSEALQHWRIVESVLKHPRCLNCHTTTQYTRQADEQRPHQFRVTRGHDDKGPPGARCTTCHQAQNAAGGGPPGVPDWHAAPRSMAWERAPGEAMSSDQLCRTLLDRKKNGNRDIAALQEHMAKDKLVLWAWSPGLAVGGDARTVPPVSHDAFLQALRLWAEAGAVCP